MISKEEIEKVAKILSCDNCPTSYACEACDITWTDKQLLKKYIDQLEQENKEAYWKGYIQKQNEAMKICKICKYRKKVRNLESDNYELNNRLNDYIEERNKQNKIIDEMAKDLVGLTVLDIEKEKFIDLEDKEEVKQYFEKKVEGK